MEALDDLARLTGDEVTVVFDGPALAVDTALVAVACVSCADDRIVELVTADAEPATLTVATSDRELAGRIRDLGALVVRAGSVLRVLDQVSP